MNSQYVLLTAAKDEETCISEVIQLVVRQTVLPLVWIIIDDGSSDQTASIVERFAAEYPFIQLYSAESREGRNFGSQYKAIRAAYELAKPLEFDFVAVQDADQAPEQADYYESILGEFQKNFRLGIVSGLVYERPRGVWEYRQANSADSTAGSAVFRRTCFEQIGGYAPLKYGGSDWLAQLDARMKGWEIQTRPDLHILHYRPTSSAGGIWRGKFREGLMDASFGSHPVFEFLKCCRRMTNHPFLLGSLIRFSGYLWWNLTRRKPLLSPEKEAFLRKEQLAKVHGWARSFFGIAQP
ncbi:glycosyltransferase family 2 protein [Candidatus Methylomicrobium oryzae]|jgi:biofilm PGA synthesis N-glycosyltransferase PgaC|uniref:glycosyltransferase family 2 protein n=1 Tax=Candidatus Methylomicrobium oryzae TaxID=2802053 RepID=UPI001924B9C1|nr:glycosyltransferase family A protein [Methylomicrobium sp. RS1]MBL1264888.1 glycosyltransferase family 2 protein [Methylomicrobium sp. RS1]